jgi:hypothetical protein
MLSNKRPKLSADAASAGEDPLRSAGRPPQLTRGVILTKGRGMYARSWAILVVLLLAISVWGCSKDLYLCGEEIYRATGHCHRMPGGEPIAGLVVSYLVTRADSLGFHVVTQGRDTTDASGYYWILLDFTRHGVLGFEASGFRRVVVDVCSDRFEPAAKEDHELWLNLYLDEEVSGAIGTLDDGK